MAPSLFPNIRLFSEQFSSFSGNVQRLIILRERECNTRGGGQGMQMFQRFCFVAALAAFSAGCASDIYSIVPLASDVQTVRYNKGAPTTYSDLKLGAVEITPLHVADSGKLVFGIAAFNKAAGPSNFGVENISVTEPNGAPDKVYTSAELIADAQTRAAWAKFAVILAGGLEAYSATQNARYQTTGSAYGQVGGVGYSSSFSTSSYSPAAAQIGLAEARADMRDGLAGINNALDRQIANIDQRVLQTTTVDQQSAYGGLV
ncbi:MAG TPA: hypothetical protein VGG10_15520, partial [Rhizomicrobium sp.]